MGCCSLLRGFTQSLPQPNSEMEVLLLFLFSAELLVSGQCGIRTPVWSFQQLPDVTDWRELLLSAHRSRLRQPWHCSVQGLLLVGLDGEVGGGVCDAGEDETVLLLVLVQEGLV